MLKELLDRILVLQNPEALEVCGRKYTTKPLHPVLDAEPSTLEAATLTGFVDYILTNVDQLEPKNLIVHVIDHANVALLSGLHGDFKQRDTILHAQADLLQMQFNTFLDSERFNIFVQACFQDTPDRTAVLRCAATIVEGAVRTTGDDGVSQEITVRQGIQRKDNQTVPNPVELKPFRTFVEVDQPASKFIFRMKEGPMCMLVEADGGAWRNEARNNIKEYLNKALPDGMVIIA